MTYNFVGTFVFFCKEINKYTVSMFQSELYSGRDDYL